MSAPQPAPDQISQRLRAEWDRMVTRERTALLALQASQDRLQRIGDCHDKIRALLAEAGITPNPVVLVMVKEAVLRIRAADEQYANGVEATAEFVSTVLHPDSTLPGEIRRTLLRGDTDDSNSNSTAFALGSAIDTEVSR